MGAIATPVCGEYCTWEDKESQIYYVAAIIVIIIIHSYIHF